MNTFELPTEGAGRSAPIRLIAVTSPDPDPARDVVVRLGRAVQRAAIYPAAHPSVRLALGPVLETLQDLARGGTRLLLVVMRDRLVGSVADAAPREFQSRWLASQLFARRITSLTFESLPDAEELLEFVRWVGLPAREAPPLPALPGGIRITQLDVRQAQFGTEARAADVHMTPALAAWSRVAALLLPDAGGSGPAGLGRTPEDIARTIEGELAAAEGTGVAVLTTRLIDAGSVIGSLPEDQRHAVRQRLAAVVGALPEDLRRQLLRAAPNDQPRRLELLTEIVESLSQERILELIPRVDMTPGPHVRQFLTFLVKLVSLGSSDPAVGDALDSQLTNHGLPVDMLHTDAGGVEALLDQLFTQTAEHFGSVGDLYRASLQDLSVTAPEAAAPLDLSLYGTADDAGLTVHDVARIAQFLVKAAPREVTTAACLARLLAVGGRDLDAGDVSLLAELPATVTPVIESPCDPVALRLAQQCLAMCREDRTSRHLLVAIEAHVGPLTPSLIDLFVAAGLPAAVLAITRMSELGDGTLRDRLGELVARLDLDIVRTALLRVCADGVPVTELLALFRQFDPARSANLARLFIRDPNPYNRLHALEMLSDAPMAPVKRERAMVHALADTEQDIVRVALRDLCVHQTPGGLTAVAEFLARPSGGIEALQIYAIHVLEQAWTPRVPAALTGVLRTRRHVLDPASRHVSRAIVGLLENSGTDTAVAAVRSWRRSIAGVWSAYRGDRLGVPS